LGEAEDGDLSVAEALSSRPDADLGDQSKSQFAGE
jgi:hypothetical protein